MRARKPVLITLSIVMVGATLLWAAPAFIPVSAFRGDVQAVLTEALGRPVQIGALSAEVLPRPRLAVAAVTVGGEGEMPPAQLGRVEVVPELLSLLKGELAVRRIRLHDVSVSQPFLAELVGSTGGGTGDAAVPLHHVSIDSLVVRLPDGGSLGPYRIDVRFGLDGELQTARAEALEEKLTVALRATETGYAVDVAARQWRSPMGPPLALDELSLHGRLEQDSLAVTHLEAVGFGGSIRGKGRLIWGKDWQLRATLEAQALDAAKLMKAVGHRGVEGRLDAKVRVVSTAAESRALLGEAGAEGTLELQSAAFHGAGLPHPLRFARLSLDGRWQGTSLDIGKLRARGYGGELRGEAKISWRRGWRLEGRIDASTLALEPLLKAMEMPYATGRANVSARIRARARDPAQLFRAATVDGTVEVVDGSVRDPEESNTLFQFRTLSTKAHIAGKRLKLRRFTAQAHGGDIEGRGDVTWSKGWQVLCRVQASGVDTEPLIAPFVDSALIGGRLSGRAKIRLAAVSPSGLAERPDVDAEFEITDGVIYGADLEKAAQHFSKTGLTGGQTPFEEFRGHVWMGDGEVRLSKLQIASSVLEASGKVHVSATEQLDGLMEVGVRKTRSVVSVPVEIAGTLDAPRLRPTKEALVGGAAGTVILGPGVGTAVGLKAGSLFKKIGSFFGGGSDEDEAAPEED